MNNKKITYWGYQLQQINLKALKSSKFNLIVIDYSQDGSNDTVWTRSELSSVQSSGKILLSYLSIGEAERYRFYWNDSWTTTSKPDWLGAENPDWQGNYKVKYWEQGWQDIIYHYLDIIMAQGFNGVYLDIIDAYQYYENLGVTNARSLMIDFVHNISDYSRAIAGQNFLIFPQNGVHLLDNATYRSIISGIGVEDLFYQNTGIKNSPTDVKDRTKYLDLLVNENKPVLTVDYVNDKNKQEDVYTSSRSKGYIPYTTVLDLNSLTPPLLINSTDSGTTNASGFGVSVILSCVVVIAFSKKLITKKR